jgi:4-methyl-5(b-hydroxyethyl)-thiazole monophosphate biosynthesis
MKERILVPLAEGFEEIEAATIVDVLRRAELDVLLAGLEPGPVTGAHGLCFDTDCSLDEVDPDTLGMIVLPGGMPGTTHLLEDRRVLELIRALDRAQKRIAAICAAPIVLAAAGVLRDGPATSYPAFQDRLGGARVEAGQRVVRAGRILTSQGPGTALEFALSIVAELCGEARSQELAAAMLVSGSAR